LFTGRLISPHFPPDDSSRGTIRSKRPLLKPVEIAAHPRCVWIRILFWFLISLLAGITLFWLGLMVTFLLYFLRSTF